MPTTDKVMQQVQRRACAKSMSAEKIRYSHSNCCTERNLDPKPEEIPVPKMEIKITPTIKDRKILPDKRTRTTQPLAPTQDADEVPAPPPPEPSRQPPEKRETPDQFWNNTMKNMREKKLSQ